MGGTREDRAPNRRVELRVERNRHQKAGHRADERDPTNGSGVAVAPEGKRQQTRDNRHPDGKREIRHHQRTTHHVSSATTPITIDSA